MIELTLPPFGSARVWFNEHPALVQESTGVLTRTLAASPRIRTTKRAGVELFVPSGALTDYALICGDFVPSDLGDLTVRLSVCTEPGEHLTWSLAATVDEVRVGLPTEYAQSVLDAVSAAPEVLGSGTLVLAPAAHGIAGSSPRMFSRVTSALLDIMALNTEDVTNELLSRILQSRRE